MIIIATNTKVLVTVDDEDYERLSKFVWFDTGRSIYRNIINRKRTMSCEIMNKRGVMFDHKDRNYLNHRKFNLRPANFSQNNMNRSKGKGTSSIYKGVTWFKSKSKWGAQIKINRNNNFLGLFIDEKEAAKAYNEAAKKYFGEFACLNQI